MRQVVPSALAFSFDLVAQGTPVEGAELEIDEVPVTGECRACKTESQLAAFPLLCNSCGSHDMEIRTGEELYVESLELKEHPAQTKS